MRLEGVAGIMVLLLLLRSLWCRQSQGLKGEKKEENYGGVMRLRDEGWGSLWLSGGRNSYFKDSPSEEIQFTQFIG